ncbi:Hypothetical predicted protein [Paramuricea clavata]|uniref:Uncharacterized protein n=1 Tax=Paramuricea clavata TaxID=317549 RepID=A0A6S7H144_PARCT|nr:Hypothetical predicted protein [Paramuricea clavata]
MASRFNNRLSNGKFGKVSQINTSHTKERLLKAINSWRKTARVEFESSEARKYANGDELGIDPGLNCIKYTCKVEKKKSKDIDRKNSILFKQRRNQLHSRRIQGTAKEEKQELGPAYKSGIGTV